MRCHILIFIRHHFLVYHGMINFISTYKAMVKFKTESCLFLEKGDDFFKQ